jgi:UDP-N-acetylglucosamine 2-epimerase
MSQIFFEGLNLFTPHYNLGIGSHLHGKQTGLMLEGIENILLKEKPSLVIVYGDTNSTLAGALAASKLDIPVAHIEAGLRCYDTKMPEEINRRLSDHIASLLFAPTQTAVSNLEKEGIRKGVFLVGDVMYDVFLSNNSLFEKNKSKVLKKYGLKERRFAFVTLHRAENTQNKKRWRNIIKSLTLLSKKGLPIFWPAHPRTNALVRKINANDLQIVPPLSYLETQVLIGASKIVITDSGGIQKEAGFQKKTCLILRDRTELVDLVELGCAFLSMTTMKRL